jgi:eukaryotic-like serine/threonine-protein kinase
MTPAPDDSPSREARLEALLHSYLQALDAGQSPDRAALLAGHPEFASELAAFFADQDRLDSVARAIRPPLPPAAGAPTLGE